ncbi:MAG: hypothetical protein RML12_08290 [Xanthomonadales bacterium]|nr:hypothetical protein [Xanthomonadales bacterium]
MRRRARQALLGERLPAAALRADFLARRLLELPAEAGVGRLWAPLALLAEEGLERGSAGGAGGGTEPGRGPAAPPPGATGARRRCPPACSRGRRRRACSRPSPAFGCGRSPAGARGRRGGRSSPPGAPRVGVGRRPPC